MYWYILRNYMCERFSSVSPYHNCLIEGAQRYSTVYGTAVQRSYGQYGQLFALFWYNKCTRQGESVQNLQKMVLHANHLQHNTNNPPNIYRTLPCHLAPPDIPLQCLETSTADSERNSVECWNLVDVILGCFLLQFGQLVKGPFDSTLELLPNIWKSRVRISVCLHGRWWDLLFQDYIS